MEKVQILVIVQLLRLNVVKKKQEMLNMETMAVIIIVYGMIARKVNIGESAKGREDMRYNEL